MAVSIDWINIIDNIGFSLSETLGYGSRNSALAFAQQGAPLASGTTDGKVDKVGVARLIIDPSSSTTIDLNTDLTNPFGTTQNFAKVKVLKAYIPVTPTDAQSTNITLFDSVSQGFYQGTITGVVGGDSAGFRSNKGIAVTGASNDKLKFTNGDATNKATIDLIVMGN